MCEERMSDLSRYHMVGNPRPCGYIDEQSEFALDVIKKIGRTLYKWWMAFARFLGNVNAVILLTVFYFLIIGPMSLVVKLLRKDLMSHRKSPSGSFWKEKEEIRHTVEQARHQF